MCSLMRRLALGFVLFVLVPHTAYAFREANCSAKLVIDGVPEFPFFFIMATSEEHCLQHCSEAISGKIAETAALPNSIIHETRETSYQCMMKTGIDWEVIGHFAHHNLHR